MCALVVVSVCVGAQIGADLAKSYLACWIGISKLVSGAINCIGRRWNVVVESGFPFTQWAIA